MTRKSIVLIFLAPFVLVVFFFIGSCKQREFQRSDLFTRQLDSSKTEKILMVSAEQTGIFNTGGLGHTVASLAGALQKHGFATEVIMPYYEDISPDLKTKAVNEHNSITALFPSHSNKANAKEFVFSLHSVINPSNGVKTWLLKNEKGSLGEPGLFDNSRKPNQPKVYTNSKNEAESFLAFNKAVSKFILKRDHTIINLHDWHTATVRVGLAGYDFLEAIQRKRFLFTISNMGYQGLAAADIAMRAGLNEQTYYDKAEFYGLFNSLKYALETSDFTLTVSPNYLKEIATKRFSGGLEGLVEKLGQEFRISAILNGTDVEQWNPSRTGNGSINETFTSKDLTGKSRGKSILQAQLGFAVSAKSPLLALTSRIADQKGFAYLPGALEGLAAQESVQIVILGDGEERYVKEVQEIARRYPAKIKYFPFDSSLERSLTAYSDFFVNTPWYEPSGTNQLFAMKNGTIPILTRVGGLADFVVDGKTGFLIDLVLHENKVDTDVEKSRQAVLDGFRRALDIYHNQPANLAEMRRACMAQDNSWELRMPVYERLFRYLRGRGDLELARSRSGSRVGFLTSVGTPIEDLLGFYEKIPIDDSNRP